MALLDDLRTTCRRIVDRGWNVVFKTQGFDLEDAIQGDTEQFAEALAAPLTIDRSVPGFDDFTEAGKRAITPGKPAASLLYHAIASPHVHPDATNRACNPTDYPSIRDLDIVENYIYSLNKLDFSTLRNPVIAVFAYQYRTASGSPHGQHADLAFSRCGIARVGTLPPDFNFAGRHFNATDGNGAIRALPARYAAFIAEYDKPLNTDVVLSRQRGDQRRNFAMPVHKLFSGAECLGDTVLSIDFQEFHRNEKLRRIHTSGGVRVVDGFDINVFPFVRDSENGGNLVGLEMHGSSVLVVPVDQQNLVRYATQANSVSGKQEVVRFIVPKATDKNRFVASLLIPSDANTGARHAPEYVNIRHKVEKEGDTLKIVDLKSLKNDDFERTVKEGKYEAAHYIDDSCDGVLTTEIAGLPSHPGTPEWKYLPAYSLVTAPDFMPFADQTNIAAWTRLSRRNSIEHFSQGSPNPLCEGRERPNLMIPLPNRPGTRAFELDDETAVAIVGSPALSGGRGNAKGFKGIVSHLTDAAADVFAPGWDVSRDVYNGKLFYSSHGLGSPFPEDAQLCAALNSFWPAAAPDASRTFGFQYSPTAIPMLDNELGFHPNNPQVQVGDTRANIGWDGETGPFFEDIDGKTYINFANVRRSDYVTNALAGTINSKATASVTSDDLIERMEALQSCISSLPPVGDMVATTRLWLVRAVHVSDWSAVDGSKADDSLGGSGYIYEFGLTDGDDPLGQSEPATEDVTRRRHEISEAYECHLSASLLFFRKKGDANWTSVDRSGSA